MRTSAACKKHPAEAWRLCLWSIAPRRGLINSMKKLSLRAKIMFGGILIVLVPLIVVGAVTFSNSSRTLEDISKQQFEQIAQGLSNMIQMNLQKELIIVMALAADQQIITGTATGTYDDINRKLADMFRKIGADYEGLAVLDQNGTVRSTVNYKGLDRKSIGIHLHERDYFRAARKGKPGVGTPVRSKVSGEPIIGICAPIFSNEGAFVGAALAVVKIDFLMKQTTSIKLGETGYPFMLDARGTVIAHPNRDLILKVSIKKEAGMEKIAQKMLRGEKGSEEYTIRGKKKVAGFAPVGMTGWVVGITQDMDEIMALAYANRNFILMISFVFLVTIVGAVFFFSESLSAPIQKTLSMLNQAIDQAMEAIVIIGLDRRIQFVNPAMARIVDQPPQMLIGRELLLDGTDKASDEAMSAAIAERKTWVGNVTGRRKDGTGFVMDMTITPVKDDAGRVICILAIGRDITHELKMEGQIRQGQKMEAIGTLAGGIAHDFNNILGAIFGYTELTIDALEDKEKSARYLAETLKAATRARDLVNQILTFSRRTDQEKRPLMPRYIIKEALKLLRASLPTTIQIQDSVKSRAFILGDAIQVHQMIMNLCTNAGYAMKEKGGILDISLDDIDIDESFSVLHPGMDPGRHLRLKVSDSGCGIPSEYLERIFDPFFTTKPHGEGTGLGLSVVHGIVKSLKGTVSVYSEAGKGTTFTVYLPILPSEDSMIEDQAPAETPRGTGRILLVDDEQILVRAGKDMLENLGYQVRSFDESPAAWEAFQQAPHDFDAVITDYTMPHMTGFDLAQNVRRIRADIPIILCSGYIDIAMEDKARQANVDEFLRKPITRQDMALALRRALGKDKTT